MRIALDAMGGDHAPGPIVAGAVQAVAGNILHHEDGRQDLAILTTAADGTSQVWVYPGNGKGGFAAPVVSAAGQGRRLVSPHAA